MGKEGIEGIDGRLGIVNDGMDGIDGIDMDGMDMRGMCCEMDGRPTDGRNSEILDVEFLRNCVLIVGKEGKPHAELQSGSTSTFGSLI